MSVPRAALGHCTYSLDLGMQSDTVGIGTVAGSLSYGSFCSPLSGFGVRVFEAEPSPEPWPPSPGAGCCFCG